MQEPMILCTRGPYLDCGSGDTSLMEELKGRAGFSKVERREVAFWAEKAACGRRPVGLEYLV